MDWQNVFFEYVCPVGGCFLASSVFAAPIKDLNFALSVGSLRDLNTVPWAVMTGNCIGWCAYSYYTADPFVLASNLPGLILSLWLNIGACKLQYLGQIRAIQGDFSTEGQNVSEIELRKQTASDCRKPDDIALKSSPQDVVLFSILGVWAIFLVCVRWLSVLLEQYGLYLWEPKIVVGILVNINLVFFYGAPLQTMKKVLETKASDSIHSPTVTMNVINAIFWMSYGLAREDVIIYGPNGVGLLLGICQVVLCCMYPKNYVSIPTPPVGEETAEFHSVSLKGSIT